MSYDDTNSTWAMWFACIYAIMACVSFLGCALIMCKSDSFAKFYALTLIVCTGFLTVGEYWVIGGLVNSASDADSSVDGRNYEGFKVAVVWFLQLNLYLLAAYDAWDTSDESKIDVADMARR